MDVIDVLGDLLVDLEKSTSSPTPRKEESKLLGNAKPLPSIYVGTGTASNLSATNNKNTLLAPPVEPSFLYSPDKDILTGLPLGVRTPSPGPLSPRLPGGSRPSSALSHVPEEVPTYSINDSNQDFKFQSYHLDYKYTPPPIKGPCCVCGDGIMGAMVTALDKMWHPEHFCCVHCGIELRSPMYLEHDGKPYCKVCHGRLFLPPCAGCGGQITTGNYIKAMEKIWHPDCFNCTRCRKVLTPTNYFQKEGKPYCEDDYYDLFAPKCFACKKPIKDQDRMISVLGRHWHPEHFKCCECGIQLKPTNFKERNGKLYCEKDFNDKFMPKCGGCHTPVLSNGITAMGKTWHPHCFNCTECKKQLNPDRFFEKDGKPYCEDDFHKLFSPKCGGCMKPIKDPSRMITAMGKNWHPDHFNCTECGKVLSPNNYFEKNGLPYCEDDYHKLFSAKCAGCERPIKDPTRMITAMGKPWHPEHFNCTECGKILTPNNYFENNGLPYCEDDYHKLFSPKCAGCNQPIKDQTKMITAQGKKWHPEHFNCTECGKVLSPNKFFEKDGLPYCEDDFHRLFSPRCAGCSQPIKDNNYVFAMNQYWHPEHFTCDQCGKQLKENEYFEKDGRIYCYDDWLNLFAPRCVACKHPIKEEYCLMALGGDWHADCFRCKDCHIRLEDRNFFEIDGEPYCDEHFHARQCPDCIKMRRAQDRYFGVPHNDSTPMGPGRWASQVSLKSLTDFETTIVAGQDRPVSQLSQYSTTSYDTAYTTDGGGRSSPSMRSYLIPIEREDGTHIHGDACSHNHSYQDQAKQQASYRSSLKRGQSQSELPGTGSGMGKWSNSMSNLQYIARNENPYNYLEPGRFPVEPKHIRFSDTVTKREFETDGKYY